NLTGGTPVLLIIEDDDRFARALLEIARERGYSAVVAPTGNEGLELAHGLKPVAITLDVCLPDMDGWVVLDQLKHDASTRHIPVHVISASDEMRRGLQQGAIAVLQKPVTRAALDNVLSETQAFLERSVKRLLLVDADEAQRASIIELLGSDDVETQ